ncbi:amidohydrolase family protein [Ignavibacteria bacterium]|nr:amidohydrolase family protein [Bacteroidota bacterium]MCZ2133794.1 amidohydrolase family protein [Bacteroidota bacterium]
MSFRLFLAIAFLFSTCLFNVKSQEPVQTAAIDGLRDKYVSYIALTNVTLVPEPGVTMQNAIVIIRDGIIEAAGTGISVPRGATVRDCKGLWLYSAFIEPYSDAGVVKKTGENSRFAAETDDDDIGKPMPVNRGARYWNAAVRPEFRTAESVALDETTADGLRRSGFALAQVNSTDGIMRGSSSVVFARAGTASQIIAKSDVSQWLSFRKGNSANPYPSSMMGSIALIRQAFSDAAWYAAAHTARRQNPALPVVEINLSLEALAQAVAAKKAWIFETNNELTLLRGSKIAQEFNLPFIYLGSGREYRRLASIAALKPTIILPVNFPSVPDVSTPQKAADITLADLKYWDAAPANPMRLDSAGLRFAFTAHGLKERGDFLKNIRKAVQYGLPVANALAALTTIPAEICGIAETAGSIKSGKWANLLLSDGDIFDAKTTIRSVFAGGKEYKINPLPDNDLRGYWTLWTDGLPPLSIYIAGKAESPEISLKKDSINLDGKFIADERQISISFTGDTLGYAGLIRLSGLMDSIGGRGTAFMPNGLQRIWTARRDSAYVQKQIPPEVKSFRPAFGILQPDGPFGFERIPEQKTVLFKSATIWTSAESGTLKESDILISGGKIIAIGKNIAKSADTTIDVTGKHITAGIVDEHSHIAISGGVNEGTSAITSEVRIGDVLNPDDISIYRQLSGGVTSSHLLHGSANPVGGQLQFIKLRWGADADGIKFDGTPPTIKFALGENVKQSNWGERFTTRYPQTRMGVEEIMRDGFQAALEYEKEHSDGKRKDGLPFRRDYRLDALLEVVRGERLVHCHSYVQSEILMLIRLAEEFGFKIQTFTHILEGYKVAREIARHGATASTFSDWWAYKFEVYDAIPQNAAIMHEQGIITSVNSDDDEMGRRLNQEAAKSIKYGGISEEEAIKFCTINSAKQMKMDKRVGSLEVGKDADIVVWSGNPLSNFSRVEQTYVDGRKYFDRESDAGMRVRDFAIRAELEQRAINAAKTGEPVAKRVSAAPKRGYHCEDIDDEMEGNYEE